jgi:hypothetical protein
MISKFFSYQYLFETGFVNLSSSDRAFFIISSTLLAIGLGAAIFNFGSRDVLRRRLVNRWVTLLVTIGGLGLIWCLFRYEAVASLSAHIIILALYLAALVWAYYILRYTFTVYKKLRAEYQQQQIKNKYL